MKIHTRDGNGQEHLVDLEELPQIVALASRVTELEEQVGALLYELEGREDTEPDVWKEIPGVPGFQASRSEVMRLQFTRDPGKSVVGPFTVDVKVPNFRMPPSYGGITLFVHDEVAPGQFKLLGVDEMVGIDPEQMKNF